MMQPERNGEYFYLKDHQGNNRVACDQNGTIYQVNSYYPFGMTFGEGTDNSNNRYKYNGKELECMHGLNWYDYGARNYGPAIGRWETVDLLAEKFPGISPYVYCFGNPVRFIDPTGMAPGDVFKTPTAAAKDFGKTYNDNSVKMGQEYGSQIYKVKGGYTYTVPNVGPSCDDNGSSVTVSSAPKNSKVVTDIHTHGSYSNGNYDDNNFSGKQDTPADNKRVLNMDIGNNNSHIKGCLVTSNGPFQMYDPKTGKVTVLSQDMYHDTKDPSSPKTPNPAYTPNSANYVVRRGDSLHSIGQDHNISANEIIKQNGLNGNIKVGQVLIIRQ